MKQLILMPILLALMAGLGLSLMPSALADVYDVSAPSLDLVTPIISANRTTINAGESATVTWRCSGPVGMVAEFFKQNGTYSNSALSHDLQGSYNSGALTANAIFQVNCAANGGSAAWQAATVNISVAAGSAFTATFSGANTNTSTGTNAPTATAITTTTNVSTFNTSVATTIDTTEIDRVALAENGGQGWAIDAADEVSDTGAGKSATSGAVYCAQGANANLTNAADAAAYYASCQQNFDAANKMKRSAEFKVDSSILNGESAAQALLDFEKNFGVSKEDYLSRMLGKGGGLDSLPDLLEGKVSAKNFSEAIEASNKLSSGEMARAAESNVSGKPKAKTDTSLREALRKGLLGKENSREVASTSSAKSTATLTAPKIQLSSANADNFFRTNQTEEQELTIFDVVHLKYRQFQAVFGKKFK